MSKDSHPDCNATIHVNRKPSNFTIAPNSTIRDSSLSWAARGLLIYLLSLPPDWKVCVPHLITCYTGTQRGNGRDAVYAILNELKEKRYVFYRSLKRPDGTWKNTYEVYETPEPLPVQPETVQPDALRIPILRSTYKKKIIIAQPPVEPTAQEKTPAAGNNNSSAKKKEEKKIYPCLEFVDLPKNTMQSITDFYTEEEVQHACRLFTQKDSIYYHKDRKECIKLIQHALKHPESYKDTIDSLGQPKLTKAQQDAKKREIKQSDNQSMVEKNKALVQAFQHRKTYNGWQFILYEDHITFKKQGQAYVHSIYFLDNDFAKTLKAITEYLGIQIPLE